MKNTILLISGYKRSGKDTVGNFVQNKGFERFSFAASLKNETIEEFLSDMNYSDEVKEKPLEKFPLMVTDEFALNLAKFMVREFRTLDGQTPTALRIDAGGNAIGMLEGGSEGKLYFTPRTLFILNGSTKRFVNGTHWVGRVAKNITDNAVITDFRYKNEFETLKHLLRNHNIVTLRVDRGLKSMSTDPSERDLDNFNHDHTIINNGTIADLESKVEHLIFQINNK